MDSTTSDDGLSNAKTTSELGFGTLRTFSPDDGCDPRHNLERAYELGINYFDVAPDWGGGRETETETLVYEALGADIAQCVVSSRLDPASTSWTESVRGSLDRLRINRLDVFYLPIGDAIPPSEEVVASGQELIDLGLVDTVGIVATALTSQQLLKLRFFEDRLGVRPFTHLQYRHHLLYRLFEASQVITTARAFGYQLIPFGVFAESVLSTPAESCHSIRTRLDLESRTWDAVRSMVESITAAAGDEGLTVEEAALLWVASIKGVQSVVVGFRTMQQLERAIVTMTERSMTPELFGLLSVKCPVFSTLWDTAIRSTLWSAPDG